jgi:hypothetical protein
MRELIVVLEIRRPGFPTILMMTEPGIIGKIGFNSAGLGVALNWLTCGQPLFGVRMIDPALRSALLMRCCVALRCRCTSACARSSTAPPSARSSRSVRRKLLTPSMMALLMLFLMLRCSGHVRARHFVEHHGGSGRLLPALRIRWAAHL